MARSRLSTTTDARQLRTRAALRTAMLEAIADQPFETVTIRQLVSASGIAYATFFRHYPDKEALLEDAAAMEINRIIDIALPNGSTTTLAACQTMCAIVQDNVARWRALLTGRAKSIVRYELLRISTVLAGPATKEWPPRDLSIILSASDVIETLSWWVENVDTCSCQAVAELLYNRLTRGNPLDWPTE